MHKVYVNRAGHTLRWLAAFVFGVMLLDIVAIVNGGPIVYPDSMAYIADGDRLVRLAAPFATRPIFYGLAIWFLHWDWTVWPVLVAQAAVVAHVILLACRVTGTRLRPSGYAALLAGLAILTPLSWHVSHVLPDVFSGVLVLALFLLGFSGGGLTRAETVYLFLLATGSICFHLSNLVIGLLLFLLGVALWLLLPHARRRVRPLLLGGPILLALAAFFSFSLVVYQRLTLTPNSPPHLMAHLIADGPGMDFLRATCPASDLAICKHLSDVPSHYEAFLWGFMPNLPTAEGKLIRAQEGRVIRGTVAMFPGTVVWDAVTNVGRQLITADSKTDFSPEYWRKLMESDSLMARDTRGSLQHRGLLDGDALAGWNRLHAAVALVSAVLCAALLALSMAWGVEGPAWLIGIMFAGVLANAVACGALSGVFGRYGGRVIWLLPLGLVVGGLALAQNRGRVSAGAGRQPWRTQGRPDSTPP